jgi:DUF4097 and DUF4098 domain-containing protein YvlB
MQSSQQAAKLLMLLVALALVARAETREELRFTVGPRATVAIVNQYGNISVKPSPGNNLVVIVATRASDKVEIDRSPETPDSNGGANRVSITTHLLAGATPESGRVDYDVLVPADASVILQSATGILHAERLRGDVEVEGAQSSVDVRDISEAHVHVKTMEGAVTLTNIKGGHVEVESVSGDIHLVDVAAPQVRVSSTRGSISYDGDFGYTGEYRLTNHSGNIDAIIPQTTSAEIRAQSLKGKVQDDVHLKPKTHSIGVIPGAASFFGTTISTVSHSASSVLLSTFSGRIHLQKRQ